MHRPPRVLIVDDDRDNREAYAEYLRFRGFEIDEADTGAKAVEQALRLNPDLVLLDMRLPDIDGAEVEPAAPHPRQSPAHHRPFSVRLQRRRGGRTRERLRPLPRQALSSGNAGSGTAENPAR